MVARYLLALPHQGLRCSGRGTRRQWPSRHRKDVCRRPAPVPGLALRQCRRRSRSGRFPPSVLAAGRGCVIRLRASNISDASQPPARQTAERAACLGEGRLVRSTGGSRRRAGQRGCSSGTTTTPDSILSMTPHPAAQIRRTSSREL